jgi:hypothetical protein
MILEMAMKAIALEDLEARIEALERRQYEKNIIFTVLQHFGILCKNIYIFI